MLADIDVLGTLERRDFLAGYGEVAKYGLLGDADFFAWLEANGPALLAGDSALRASAVLHSCRMKADIVARDETERGDRALLNLGHTFGHALEAATGYSDRLLHGEGVAIGCALAFETSARLGLCPQETPSRVRAHLVSMGMKTDLADIPGDLPDADGLIDLMYQDKKVRQGRLTFIMAREIGDAFVTRDVDLEVVRGGACGWTGRTDDCGLTRRMGFTPSLSRNGTSSREIRPDSISEFLPWDSQGQTPGRNPTSNPRRAANPAPPRPGTCAR